MWDFKKSKMPFFGSNKSSKGKNGSDNNQGGAKQETRVTGEIPKVAKVIMRNGMVYCQMDTFVVVIRKDGFETSDKVQLMMDPNKTTCAIGDVYCQMTASALSGEDCFKFQLKKRLLGIPWLEQKVCQLGKAFFILKGHAVKTSNTIKVGLLKDTMTVTMDGHEFKMSTDKLVISKKDEVLLTVDAKGDPMSSKLSSKMKVSTNGKVIEEEPEIKLSKAKAMKEDLSIKALSDGTRKVKSSKGSLKVRPPTNGSILAGYPEASLSVVHTKEGYQTNLPGSKIV